MAVLTDEQRRELWAAFQRQDVGTIEVLKTELRDAVDAIDAWIDANSASLNAAIPQPARSALTVKQKAQLLVFVVESRFKVS